MRSVVVLTLLTVLAVLLAASPAGPVTLRRMDLAEIVSHADAVLVGTVARQSCARDAERPRLIVTRVTFRELTVLHGSVRDPELTLAFAGGQMGGTRLVVPGMPRFKEGERVLLFVGLKRGWLCPVVGWSQGKFTLETPDGEHRTIVRDGQGRRVTGISGARVLVSPKGEGDFDADSFLEAVRRLLPTPPGEETPPAEGTPPPDGEAEGEDDR